MAFGLHPPINLEDLSRVWFQQTGQQMPSQICMGANSSLQILMKSWSDSKQMKFNFIFEGNLPGGQGGRCAIKDPLIPNTPCRNHEELHEVRQLDSVPLMLYNPKDTALLLC